MFFLISCICFGFFSGYVQSAEISCPQGWRAFDGYCYLVSSQVLTWSQARSFCIEKGGELVKITSQRENDFVLSLARKEASSLKEVWIGLKRNGGDWYWSDYSLPKYANWAPNEPGNSAEECAHMYTGHSQHLPYKASGSWNDLFCNGLEGFSNGLVCKQLP